jgi:serine/threonine protein kinase
VLREIVVQSICYHPSIARLRGWNVTINDDQKCIHMVIDYATGGTLSAKLGTLTVAQQRIILYGMALGVQYLHDNEILHRDIKPDNIVLDSQGYPLLIDFGFAKYIRDICQTTSLCTQRYKPPEMSDPGYQYGFPADIFSLGITFAEVLNGECWEPANEAAQTDLTVSIGHLIAMGQRPPFHQHISPLQRSLIEGMLWNNPDDRFSIHEVVWRLADHAMWPEAPDAAFEAYKKWLADPTREIREIDQTLLSQCNNGLDACMATQNRCAEMTLREHVAEVIGFLTGEGKAINEEMEHRVLVHLQQHESLTKDVFSPTAEDDA